jgi:fatty-acyl-CoA synthase
MRGRQDAMNTSEEMGRSRANGARSRLPAAKAWLRAIELTSDIEANPDRTFSDVIEACSVRHPDRLALISDTESFTYEMLSQRINRYARWALINGIGAGDTVCLLMPNRPEYLAAWLGITKVGGVVALINTKLVGTSLAHCINLARPRHVIVAASLGNVFKTAAPYLDPRPQFLFHGGDESTARVDTVLDQLDGEPLPLHSGRKVTINERALLIYTSGTTGLPKAASVSHRRIMNWAGWFAGLMNAEPADRMYNCLPIYHSVGGIVAPCSMLTAGASVVLAESFSASGFWSDIVRFDCTLFQYIGELCRYLLRVPTSDSERQHRLRMACGNGLRADIWEAFQQRFAIPQILEFYAATEGNFSLYNVEGKPGAIGRIPPFLAHRLPVAIVRFDADRNVPLRSQDGRCIRCARGETGEAISRIKAAKEAGGLFEGYTDPDETEKKIVRNAFASGDAWFRTGDLMRLDENGFFYFVDRIGDTFRWKGENIAACEVADVIANCSGIVDVSVYGVAISGVDGRAGMAALVVEDGFDLNTLTQHLATRLPAYACPVFIRICPTLDITETFKQKKQELVLEGFDPHHVRCPLFVRDATSGQYFDLDADIYASIFAGLVRL